MSVLANPRHERFAQELAKGSSAAAAYIAAGYKANRGAASRMQRDGSIVQRVTELQQQARNIETEALQQAVDRLAITKERVLGELAAIGFANMLDYMQVGAGGDPVLNFADLTRDQAAALAEVTVEDFKDGRGEGSRDVRRVKFKLHDKKGALVDLGKHLGLFVERFEGSLTVRDVSSEPLSDAEWAAQHVTEH